MRGEYDMKITGRRDGGFKIRIANSKTKKASQFTVVSKNITNAQYFAYLFQNTIEKIK
mgnify:FL=1|jgi:hypothetical protein